MPGSESYAPFDVVVVPFPYSDRLAEKRRPALVVSSTDLSKCGVAWVVMITSAGNRSRDDDVPIADLRLAGLQVASVVRPTKIATIEPSRILRRAGALDEATAKSVAHIISSYLARPR
jgi:mRNA interferase MazF